MVMEFYKVVEIAQMYRLKSSKKKMNNLLAHAMMAKMEVRLNFNFDGYFGVLLMT
jgi:hypothetical protein